MWHIVCMIQCFIYSIWHYIFMSLHQHDTTFHLQRSTLRLHVMSLHQRDNFDDIASSWCNWIDVNLVDRVQRTWEWGLTWHIICSIQHHIFTIWCCFVPQLTPRASAFKMATGGPPFCCEGLGTSLEQDAWYITAGCLQRGGWEQFCYQRSVTWTLY